MNRWKNEEMKMPNPIDMAIAAMFPGWGVKRAIARRKLRANTGVDGSWGARNQTGGAYAAGKRSRVDKEWNPRNSSAESAIAGSLPLMLGRSRQMVRDNWMAASAQGAYRRHVVGTGITVVSTATNPDTGEDIEQFNDAIDELWEEWSSTPEFCDIERRKTVGAIQSLWMDEIFDAGQAMTIMNYQPRRDMVGLYLQVFDPEQLNDSIASFGGHRVWRGIEVDDFTAPLAYHVHTGGNPTDVFRARSERVEANRVLHMFRQSRARQILGPPWMHPVLVKARYTDQFDQYTLIKARGEAAFGGVIVSNDETQGNGPFGTQGAPGDDNLDARGNREMNMEPGMWPRLRNLEDIRFAPPVTPNSMYDPFKRRQITEAAAGMGLDYSTVARDFSKTNFSGLRQGLLETWDETDAIREQIIMPDFVRVRRAFKELAIMEDRVKAPRFFTDPRWRRAYLSDDYQGPPKLPVDPAKAAAANKINMELGIESFETILNERGVNWKQRVRRLKHIKETLDKAGIKIPGINGPSKVNPVEPRPERDDGNDDPNRGLSPDDLIEESRGAGGTLTDRLVEGVLQDAMRDHEPVGVE